MNKIPMSRAAARLLSALLDRAGADRNRVLLSEVHSCDWQSLTLTGERHVILLRVAGPQSEPIIRALTDGIEDADFVVPGQIVADIAVMGEPLCAEVGSLSVSIEALTIAE